MEIREDGNCLICGKVFSKTGKGLHSKKFCSKKCRQKYCNSTYHKSDTGRYNTAKKESTRSRRQNSVASNWDLSIEEYTEKISSNSCYYCGGPLPNYGAALDRLDSNIGYSVDNVVPCCKYCNTIKSNLLSPKETKELIALLKKLRGKEEIWGDV